MANESTIHKVNHTFEIEIEQNDEEEDDRRYQAHCGRRTGCRVYASSNAKALRRISQAIDIWLNLADRQLTDEELSFEERIDSLLPD